LWSVGNPQERIGKLVEAGRRRGGNAYTILSSRGEVGHAVNENPRSLCGVVGDNRSNVNIEEELDCELPGDSSSMSKSGVMGLIGQIVVCVLWRAGGRDTRRGTLSSVFLVDSSSERTTGRFGPEWVPPLAGFGSPVRVFLEFVDITD